MFELAGKDLSTLKTHGFEFSRLERRALGMDLRRCHGVSAFAAPRKWTRQVSGCLLSCFSSLRS
jgi:hypothetical protein